MSFKIIVLGLLIFPDLLLVKSSGTLLKTGGSSILIGNGFSTKGGPYILFPLLFLVSPTSNNGIFFASLDISTGLFVVLGPPSPGKSSSSNLSLTVSPGVASVMSLNIFFTFLSLVSLAALISSEAICREVFKKSLSIWTLWLSISLFSKSDWVVTVILSGSIVSRGFLFSKSFLVASICRFMHSFSCSLIFCASIWIFNWFLRFISLKYL